DLGDGGAGADRLALAALPADPAAVLAAGAACAGADPRRRLHLCEDAAGLLAAGPAGHRTQPVGPARPLDAGFRASDPGARTAAAAHSAAPRRLAGLPGAGRLPQLQRLLRTDRMVGGAGLWRRCRRLPRHPGRPVGYAVGHVPVPVRRGGVAVAAVALARPAAGAAGPGPAARGSGFSRELLICLKAGEGSRLKPLPRKSLSRNLPGYSGGRRNGRTRPRRSSRGSRFHSTGTSSGARVSKVSKPAAARSRSCSSSISQLYFCRGGRGSLRRNRKAARMPATAPPRCDSHDTPASRGSTDI